MPISEIANSPTRVEERTRKVDDGAGGLVDQKIKFPIWFDPVAHGGTPMCEVFQRATSLLQGWTATNLNSFPPIVINITDGESTDGDPSAVARALKTLATTDGPVLLFNVHLSDQQSAPIEFPDDDVILPDQYARLLFNISSALPDYMRDMAGNEGYRVSPRTRGFVFNADIVSVIRFLDIGTRPSNLR